MSPDPTSSSRPGPAARAALALTLALALPLPAAVARTSAPAAPSVATQDARPARPDQVAVRSRRGDSVTQVPGVVQENSIEKVVVVSTDGEQSYDSSEVLRVTFGEVPSSYRDGVLYFDRSEFASAAGSFRTAAGDGEARDVVRASARLRAAESFFALGAQDPARFADAVDDARRFLSDFANNREVPAAQLLLARGLLLSGQGAEAATAYREVFEKLAGDRAATGYERVQCFRAGLAAAQALLAGTSPDTLGARELFSSLSATLGPLVASLEDSPERRALQDVLDEATLGEGFAELAAGNTQSALTFFQTKQRALDSSSGDTLRYGVLLGLGESLLADARPRDAQLALSQVSALDHGSRDRVARALLRQAQAAVQLADPRESFRPLLVAIDQSYGDTPWAAPARALLMN